MGEVPVQEVVDREDSSGQQWGSDAIARLLRELGIRYIALSPGSSFRGLHESIVNLLGNSAPEILLCLHEEHAVAIAHGYAKVASEPMAVLVHSNVGLMHASMAIYNAFCDRVPVLVIGGIAPMDAARRISPAHWYHSVLDQGALVRDYVKWDDQPLSTRAALQSLLRAYQIASTAPRAPVYLSLDQRMQEDPDGLGGYWPEVDRYAAPAPIRPDAEAIERAAALLAGAERPLILAGRVSRDEEAWRQRVALAELLGADVLTDQKVGAAFPTDHPLHGTDPYLVYTDDRGEELIRDADVVLSLDWVDMVNLFRRVWPHGEVPPKIVHCSLDRLVHNGWSRDHQALPAVDVDLLVEPDAAVPALLEALNRIGGAGLRERGARRLEHRRANPRLRKPVRAAASETDAIGLWDMGEALAEAADGQALSLVRVPLGWHAGAFDFRHPLDYLGYDGAGGIGSGPGQAVGAALALRGSGRIPVALLGDGDYLMGATALWSAVHHRIPLLVMIANNQSYYVDEEHQRVVSRQRNRTLDNAWIGQRISDPEVDLTAVARAQGWQAEDPISRRADLAEAIRRGLAAVEAGRCCLIDVRIVPDYKGLVG
jgi:thiamine pyrophosphate-dependent acetolactate synthase large subunit-like protein